MTGSGHRGQDPHSGERATDDDVQPNHGGHDTALVAVWPLLGLRLATARLELAVPTSADLADLFDAAAAIQPPGQARFQQSFLYASSPERERGLLQRHWRALAHWRPDSWDLHLAIRLDGTAIGVQSMWATDFAITRTVETGSWIGLAHQGRGYGTEARMAVLELAFTHLGAAEARTAYVAGNLASEAVSRKLGYQDNGHKVSAQDGERLVQHLMAIDAATWKRRSRGPVEVTGLTRCLDLFGVAAGS
ncbi:GNAT family N-acetyltransferase [Nonomuraea sp. NPDC005692]|uniref:GNAT family N-acetyltransferase n=1 Tax=Nonomuraea sp. NPDC005692 TaxID=3157168 RepID=UPI0033FB5250